MIVVLRLVAPQLRRLVLAALAGAASDLAALALMATAAWLICRAAQQPPLAALTVAIVAVRALALSRGVFRYAERLIGHDVALGAVAELRSRVYAALVPQAPTGLHRLRSAHLLTRLVDDVDAVQDLLLRCLLPAFVAVIVTGAAVGLTAVIMPVAGIVLAAGLLLAGSGLPLGVVALSGPTNRRIATAREEVAATTVDLVEGAADLAAYGAAETMLTTADEAGIRLGQAERRKSLVDAGASALLLLLQGVTTAGVIALGAAAVADGRLSGPLLAVVALTSLLAFEVVAPLPTAAHHLLHVRAAVRPVTALVDRPAAVPETARPLPAPTAPLSLSVRGVVVRYAPDRPPALDEVDLDLVPGRRVAVVGASGSGKSTLLAVLTRFVPIDAGSVLLNGRGLQEYDSADVRSVVGGVLQHAHVFHTTVAANLRLARPDATDTELADAAARARLLPWIQSLPAGWETVVGADGGQLSGGQRTRLVLARALLADPPVLLLDEPTEGLDPDVAAAVTRDLLGATRGRTTVLVTHRLDELAAVDEVVVLDRGRVLQRGSHRDLLDTPGYYRDIWAGSVNLPSTQGRPSVP